MSLTHNKFKNIENEIFSPESSFLSIEKLNDMRSELMETRSDAVQNNQIFERWNIVDSKISSLIKDASLAKQNSFSKYIIQFVIAVIVLAIGIFLFEPLREIMKGP